MRSSLLPRRRPLERICDACQQQRRELSSSTNRSIGLFSKPSPSPCTASASIPRRSQAPTASLISNRAFSCTRNAQGAEAASRKPAEPESSQQEEQQQQPSSSASIKQAVVPPTHYELFPETFPQGPRPTAPSSSTSPPCAASF
ncbi:Co-chaperone Hsc20 [Apiospora hydei]|uniref:Co-chaperone Hsc20 n=1 Tax=Apiospora hydei TaxID=1337664 RepID=A0ABR1WPM7_9PEZI